MADAEYMRAWRAAHPEKLKEYRERSRAKRGPDYWREAIKKHREKDIEVTRERWRMEKAIRRARLLGNRVSDDYILKRHIINWESKICGICNEKIEGAYHIDHIVPLSKGGAHEASNLQLAHPFCNQSKHNRVATIDNHAIMSSEV